MLPKASTSARSFWSGTISFGLVSVPVDLFAANRAVTAGLRMLGPEGQPLKRKYMCSLDGKPVASDDVVRGYEVDEGEFVTVTDEELEALEPDKTRDIDLNRFVPRSSVPPVYFDRGYYLVPSGASSKAYRLLAATMQKADKVGIGSFVMRGKAHVIAIFAENGILHAETLRFFDEMRAPKDLGVTPPKAVAPKLVAQFGKAVVKMSKATFDLQTLHDEQIAALNEVAKAKLKAHKDVVEVKAPDADEPIDEIDSDSTDEAPGPTGKVIDLMEVLRKKLGEEAKKRSASKERGDDKAATQKTRPRSAKAGSKRPKKAASHGTKKNVRKKKP